MARKRYARAAKALTNLSRAKSDYQSNLVSAQSIRAETEGKVARMNKAFDLAGQALVTADAMSQEFKTRGKIEKGVTSLAEAKGGDVSYKKTRLGDIFKGEAKLSDWGKETWNVGGDEYSRADVLAWHEKGQKDLKWDKVIGKEVTKYDEATGGVSKERVKTGGMEKKEYKIQGEAELFGIEEGGVGKEMEKKHGSGWSYSKQKDIDRAGDLRTKARYERMKNPDYLLKNQVSANVESQNYKQIMGAYKKEFRGKYDKEAVKALDLQHESWAKKNQKDASLKPDDNLKGVVKSAEAGRISDGGEAFDSMVKKGGVDQENALNKRIRDSQALTDQEIVAEGKAMYQKDLESLGLGDKKKGYFAKAKEQGFFGKRKGIDVWEDFKDKRAAAKEQKVIDSISKLTSSEDYVPETDAELSGASPEMIQDNEKIKPINVDDVAGLASADLDSDFTNIETGATLEQDLNVPEVDNSVYQGSSAQNIEVLEEMMGASMKDLTGKGTMYEGMEVYDIWNKSSLGKEFGQWGSDSAKGKRASMWGQIQEGFGGTY